MQTIRETHATLAQMPDSRDRVDGFAELAAAKEALRDQDIKACKRHLKAAIDDTK